MPYASTTSATEAENHSTTKPSSPVLDHYLASPLQAMERISLEGSPSNAKANKKVKVKKAKQYLKKWDKTWEMAGKSGSE